MKCLEHDIQVGIIRAVRLAFPRVADVFFAVPNGGQRNLIVAAKLKAEGALAGVSDLLLLHPGRGYHGLCIEVKTAKGKQSPRQRKFENAVTEHGYLYRVVRSAAETLDLLAWYLKDER